MNTAQLVVLWYAGFAIVATLLAHSEESPTTLILAIILFAGLILFTLRNHPKANKKSVAIAVLSPLVLFVLLIISVAGYNEYISRPSSFTSIPLNQIEIFDTTLGFREGYSYHEATVSGRVLNSSALTLKFLTLQIAVVGKETNVQVDGATMVVSLDVPPGETRSFTATDNNMRPPESWSWSYTRLFASGE